ncbi:hypothetical protein HPB47_000377 [Ixodes persulcatus]|uniref:Uncharacterized protein n=1 Tax=Ixodes persulcatus TaxID=34615 RepID=A0AC60PTX8_IXOPE|nr:hypothetical protein HPB47_000377 [Ixodes persulcatus]
MRAVAPLVVVVLCALVGPSVVVASSAEEYGELLAVCCPVGGIGRGPRRSVGRGSPPRPMVFCGDCVGWRPLASLCQIARTYRPGFEPATWESVGRRFASESPRRPWKTLSSRFSVLWLCKLRHPDHALPTAHSIGLELLEDSAAGPSGCVRAPAAWRRHVSVLLMFDTRPKRRKDPKEPVLPSGRLSGRLLRVRTAGEVNGTSRKLRSATVKQSDKKG